MQRFCPKCGKTVPEEKMINNFCIECYVSENPIVTAPKFEITYCPKCDSYRYAKKIFQKSELEHELSKHIRIKELEQAKPIVTLVTDFDRHEYYVKVVVKALFGNVIKEITMEKDVSFRVEPCTECLKFASNYYTTILQLRFDTKELMKELQPVLIKQIETQVNTINNAAANKNKPFFISKKVDQKTGIDIYLNDVDHTAKVKKTLLFNKHAKTWQKTRSLVSADKDGRRKYRHTICLHYGEIPSDNGAQELPEIDE